MITPLTSFQRYAKLIDYHYYSSLTTRRRMKGNKNMKKDNYEIKSKIIDLKVAIRGQLSGEMNSVRITYIKNYVHQLESLVEQL